MTQYKLVPVEPTEEMVRALRLAIDDEDASHKEWLRRVIAAAPEKAMTDKQDAKRFESELLMLCDETIRLHKTGNRSWTIATELKRRIEQPSEREKALVEALENSNGILDAVEVTSLNQEGMVTAQINQNREALAAYEEKDNSKGVGPTDADGNPRPWGE